MLQQESVGSGTARPTPQTARTDAARRRSNVDSADAPGRLPLSRGSVLRGCVSTGWAQLPAEGTTPIPSSSRTTPPHEAPAGNRLAEALFCVVVSDDRDQESYRLGTAWAIDDRTLVTTASVILVMNDLNRDGFPKSVVFSPEYRRTWAIEASTIHPQYQEADEVYRAARREYGDALESSQAITTSDTQHEQLKQTLLDHQQSAFTASGTASLL